MTSKTIPSLLCVLSFVSSPTSARVLTDLALHDGNAPTFRYSVDTASRVVQERCTPACTPFLEPIPINDLRQAAEQRARPELETKRRRVDELEGMIREKRAELVELGLVISRLVAAGASESALHSYYATRAELLATVGRFARERDGLLPALDPGNLEQLFGVDGLLRGTVVYSVLRSNDLFPGLRPLVRLFPHLFAAAYGKRAGAKTWTDPQTARVWWYAVGGTWDEVSARCPAGWRLPRPSDVDGVHRRMIRAYRDGETSFDHEPSHFWGPLASREITSRGARDVYRYSFWRDVAEIERTYTVKQAPSGGYYPVAGSGMFLSDPQ